MATQSDNQASSFSSLIVLFLMIPLGTLLIGIPQVMGSSTSQGENTSNTLVSITIKTYSINGSPINGLWTIVKSDNNSTSGFTPLSVVATLGKDYTVTLSNFQNYTFDHWDDNSTNNVRTVIPKQNTILTAYYKTEIIMTRSNATVTQSNGSAATQSTTLNITSNVESTNQTQNLVIPSWIKNNAKWWSQGQIGDSDMIKGLNYLISDGIMVIPATTHGSSAHQQIPIWIKNNAKWWSQGQISDLEFVKGVQYLISNEIITVELKQSTQNPLQETTSGNIISNAEPMGTITTNIYYRGGDRASYYPVSLKIYQDTIKVPLREIDSLTGNPFDITSLPLYHNYKVEAFVDGMSSAMDYVALDKPQQDLNLYLPLPGGMRVNVLYNDKNTPVVGASVVIMSKDNKTLGTETTDENGHALRQWLEPTTVTGDYYTVNVKIGKDLSYTYSPAFLSPGFAQEIYVVTPWPPIVNSLITVKIYNQSKVVSPTDGNFVVDLYNGNHKKISESTVNNRGEAHFYNLVVGDYTLIAINQSDKSQWAQQDITLDGTRLNFSLLKD